MGEYVALAAYFGWWLVYLFTTIVFVALMPKASKSGFWIQMMVFASLIGAGVAVSGGWVLVSLAFGLGIGIWISG